MTKDKILWIAVSVIISLCLTIWLYRRQRTDEHQKTVGYMPAEAVVIQVYPARVSRYGVKVPRYALKFADLNGKEYTQHNVELSDTYKVNDTLTVFYNPANPDDPVIDKE